MIVATAQLEFLLELELLNTCMPRDCSYSSARILAGVRTALTRACHVIVATAQLEFLLELELLNTCMPRDCSYSSARILAGVRTP